MPRIFWSKKKKARLLKDAETLTLNQLARKYFRPADEIEIMLARIKPGKKLIKHRYKENGHVVIVYREGYALGSERPPIGSNRPYY